MFHPTKTAQSDRDITEKPLPLYRVTVRQDAWINHVTLIRAESAADACEAALDGWNGDETIKFVDEGATGFDDGQCDPEDDVELVPVERETEDEADFAKSLAGEDSTIIALSKAELRLLAMIVGQHADDIHEDNPQDAAPVQSLFEKVKGFWKMADPDEAEFEATVDAICAQHVNTNGHPLIRPAPEVEDQGRTGSLIGITAAEIEDILGFGSNREDDDSKVKFSWGFEVDGKACAVWDYKGSSAEGRFSTWGDKDALALVFGSKFHP